MAGHADHQRDAAKELLIEMRLLRIFRQSLRLASAMKCRRYRRHATLFCGPGR